jgi:hypothetical protein
MKGLLSTRIVETSCYLFKVVSVSLKNKRVFCFFLYPGFLLNVFALAFFVPFIYLIHKS